MEEKIFILHTKASKYADNTYCIAICKLGTGNTEFIIGKTENNKINFEPGSEIKNIYISARTNNLEYAMKWLKKQK